jgi:predicted ATPase
VEVARSLAQPGPHGEPWRGGVAFVAMGACRTAAELGDRLVMSLRLDPAAGEPLDAVREALAGASVLLVLDNLEQAAAPAAALVSALLSTLPALRIVATSRQVLGVDGEQLLVLAPLAWPAPGSTLSDVATNPAVRLFVDRARERRSDFHLGAHNAEAIGELVRLLEGHPLAIELAAARVRSTPPAQWVALLREARTAAAFGDPGDTLALLARQGPRGGADARHASMEQVIAGSWQLLDAGAQHLLGALTVFDGGCDAAAARAVGAPEASAAAVQRTLDDLVSCSLLVAHGAGEVEGDDHEANPRFVPYEAVREYAAARCAPADQATRRARHRAWMRHLDGRRATGHAACTTPTLAHLRDEMPNLLLALASARRDGTPDEAWAIVAAHRAALTDITLPATGLDTLEAAARETADDRVRLFAHAVLAAQAYESGRHAVALAHAERVPAAIGTPDAIASQVAWPAALTPDGEPGGAADISDGPASTPEPLAAWCIGWALRIRMRVGQRIDEDDPWLAAAIDVASAAGAGALSSRLLGLKASLMMRNRDDHPGAEVLRRRALALAEASGDRLRANEARIALAICLGFQHRIEEQLPLLARAEEEARALDQPRLLCFSLSVRGYCLADLRRHDEALAAFQACLAVASRALAWRELFYGLWNLTRTLAHLREPERAAHLMGFAEAFYAQRFGSLGREDLREARRTRRLVAVQLGPDAADRAWRDGRSMDVGSALALAQATARAASATPP